MGYWQQYLGPLLRQLCCPELAVGVEEVFSTNYPEINIYAKARTIITQ